MVTVVGVWCVSWSSTSPVLVHRLYRCLEIVLALPESMAQRRAVKMYPEQHDAQTHQYGKVEETGLQAQFEVPHDSLGTLWAIGSGI